MIVCVDSPLWVIIFRKYIPALHEDTGIKVSLAWLTKWY